jgi:hypothetical protein
MRTWAGREIQNESNINLDELNQLPRYPSADRFGHRFKPQTVTMAAGIAAPESRNLDRRSGSKQYSGLDMGNEHVRGTDGIQGGRISQLGETIGKYGSNPSFATSGLSLKPLRRNPSRAARVRKHKFE